MQHRGKTEYLGSQEPPLPVLDTPKGLPLPGESEFSHSLYDGHLAEVCASTFSTEIGCEQFFVLSGRHATQDSEKPEGAA